MVAFLLLGGLFAFVVFAGWRWTLIALVATVILLVFAAGRACACNTKEKAYTTAMRSDLRHLVSLQEGNRSEGLPFIHSLTDTTRFRFSTGVTLFEMRPTATGFIAVVDYPTGTTTRCQVRHVWGAEANPQCHERR